MALDRFFESGMLLVIGMSVTITALLMLAGMIWVFKRLDEQINRRRIARYHEDVTANRIDDDVNDEVVAVIAAAALAVLRKPVRIRRIRFLDAHQGTWAVTGRLNIMASHALSKRKSAQ